MQKLTPEIVVICKIPPILDNKEANKNVDLFNENVNGTYGSKSGYQVLKLNTMIQNINNWSFLYWDKIHLNDEHGVPFLRNCLRFFICQYSKDLPRPEKVQNFNNQKQKNSVSRIHPYQQSRSTFNNLGMLPSPSYNLMQSCYR